MAKMFATDRKEKPPLMRGRFLSPRQRGGVTDDTDDTGVTDDWWQSDDLLSLSTNSLFSSKYINVNLVSS